MMDENGVASCHKVIVPSKTPNRETVFESTAGEFYQRGVDNGNPVDRYLFVTGYPYPLNLEFWGRLLNLSGNGWLESAHIDIWSNIVASSPNKDQRCGILPVDFHYILHDCERIYALANGTEGMCPPWWTLDRVLFPLNQSNLHWMLAELDLTSWNVKIYDSKILADPTPRMSFLHEILYKLQELISLFLDKLNYWSNASVERVDKLQLSFEYLGNESPQQSDSSSCGIYVCHFVETLAHRHPLHIQCPEQVFKVSYREYVTERIYATRCG